MVEYLPKVDARNGKSKVKQDPGVGQPRWRRRRRGRGGPQGGQEINRSRLPSQACLPPAALLTFLPSFLPDDRLELGMSYRLLNGRMEC